MGRFEKCVGFHFKGLFSVSLLSNNQSNDEELSQKLRIFGEILYFISYLGVNLPRFDEVSLLWFTKDESGLIETFYSHFTSYISNYWKVKAFL